MQRLKNYELILDIELIEEFHFKSQLDIEYLSKDKERFMLSFEDVWDMRYSIEEASIERFFQFRKCLPKGIVENGIYLVEDSDYIKYFEEQVSGTRPIEELKHYIVQDPYETLIDVLTEEKPKLVKISD